MVKTSNQERLDALLAEYTALDPATNSARIRDIMAEGAGLINKQARPGKWAAFRYMYAKHAEQTNPQAALTAYRESLAVWQVEGDPDCLADCHRGIGELLVHQDNLDESGREEAITHLEAAVDTYPGVAVWLAVLYQFRIAGDPWENWQKRIHFLQIDADSLTQEEDPARWARCRNELGIAMEAEPDANFYTALESRIKYHLQALAAIGETQGPTWIRTRLYLSECYLFRLSDDPEQDFLFAEHLNRQAMETCSNEYDAPLRVETLLGRVRILTLAQKYGREEDLHQGLSLCNDASSLLDSSLPAHQTYAASIESMRTNLLLKLIALGHDEYSDQLLAHDRNAIKILTKDEHIGNRRIVLQSAADGLLLSGRIREASELLQEALTEAERGLRSATSIAARMERIWEFHDSSALLCWCLLKQDRIAEALLAMDNGKARFWCSDAITWRPEEMHRLVPDGGALLFCNFATATGAVIAVTRDVTEVIWLPKFGKSRLMELQRGEAPANRLGGWLLAYSFRNSKNKEWRDCILKTTSQIYEEFWVPVLSKLQTLDIKQGAELVLFPQGGCSIFPMHAAWRTDPATDTKIWLLDEFTIRYAPSVRSLLTKKQDTARYNAMLVIANPLDDLEHSALETAWVRHYRHETCATLSGPAATPDAVLTEFVEKDLVHFSCHAMFDLNHPLESCLLLAGPAKLSLQELLPTLQRNTPKLVVLSACETGMARVTSTPDEALGFPAAFLHSGTRTVLSTLWPVDDEATAFLIGRFYRELTGGNQSPAKALQLAQNWLRKITVQELKQLLADFKHDPSAAGPAAARIRTRLRKKRPDSQPFAEPYFWAPFTISGKE